MRRTHFGLRVVVLAAPLTAPAFAQLVSEDFSVGNTHLWGVEFMTAGVHQATGGNPGGCIQLNVASASSNLPSAMIVPGAVTHPWSGNFRNLGVSGFRFDREVVQGSANFGTRLFIVLADDNGTRTDFADDAWVWVDTLNSFQFGAQPWATVDTAIPAASATLPFGWGGFALPGHPQSGNQDLDTLWDLIIQDVSYVGIAMNTPFNGGAWFGAHTLRFDNFALEGSGFGTPYCAAAANSTGAPAIIAGLGSPIASANNLTLAASSLPANAFAFFITGRSQGFVQNPGGSQGNLCLSGAIGRYVGPGQIQNSGTHGAITLPLDLQQVPQPNGSIAAQAGETWNFQAWYRDSFAGAATSNFTPGIEITFQ